MPLYEYACDACGERFEVIQKFSDPLVEICPRCGGVVHKLMSSPAIQFKGTGWYITDYAKKDSGGEGKADGSKEGAGPAEKKDASKDKDGSKEKGRSESEKSGSQKDAAPKAEAASAPKSSSGDATPKAAKTND